MKNNRFVISISLIALVISLIMIIGTKTNIFKTSYALEDTKTITIKKETDKDTDEKFKFRVKIWKDVIDENAYTEQYSELGEIGGWDGDNDQSWTITFPEGTVYQGIPMSGDYEIALDWYSGTDLISWEESGLSGEHPPLNLVVCRQFDGERIYGSPIYGHVKGYYNPMRYDNDVFYALADLMRKTESTPDVEPPGADGTWTYVDDIIIDGVTYPLFVSGYNTMGSEHFYQVAISGYTTTSEYLNLTPQGGSITSDEGVYEFEIGSGEEFTIPNILYGDQYEIYEVDKDGWELVSINDDTSLTKAEGTVTDNVTYTFKNKSTTEEPAPVEPGNNEPQEPETPASPNNNLEPKKEENKQNTALSSKKITNDKTTPKTGVNTNISNIILIIGASTLFFSIMVLMNQVFRVKHSK